jgi:oligo-1,6-glucosidase
MDLVVNHSSDEHKWFQESKNQDNPIETITTGGRQRKAHLHFVRSFEADGSGWRYDKTTDSYYLHYLAISNQI